MKFKTRVLLVFFLMFLSARALLIAQANEVVALINSFEAAARSEKPLSFDDADPVLEKLRLLGDSDIEKTLPAILDAAKNPEVSVRRLAAVALFVIARPDRTKLLADVSTTLASLLVDPDVPIRRMTGLTLANLPLTQTSPLLPSLEKYLSREDAVSTIGGGVAGLIMKVAAEDGASIGAVVQYMQRKDQTVVSRGEVLQSVQVAGTHNREIGRAVAAYVEDPNEGTSTHAIQTLQSMGKDVLSDNQQVLRKIAADGRRNADVRAAAIKALSATP